MNFIKNIIEGNVGEYEHEKLVRYGKGNYERAYMSLKKGKELKIKASFDYANDLFGTIAESIKESAEVKGKIIANYDFENEIDFLDSFSKRGKLYTGEIDRELSAEQIRKIWEKFKLHFLLLNVKSSKFKLKVGKSLPTPGGKIKEDFCSATLPLQFSEEFAFDLGDFKEAEIKHVFVIEEIIVPEEYKDDYEKIRKEGKKKGRLKRIMIVDGAKKEREVEIEV